MSLKFKRYYPTLLALILVVTFFILVMGSQRVIAYTTETASVTEEAIVAEDVEIYYTNEIALFDDTVVHSIQVIISDEDYQTMISTYQQTGEKDYFHADIIIDGVRINDVGIRLKGNASLMTALGGSGGMGGGAGFDRGAAPDAAAIPQDGVIPQFDPGNLPEGFDPNNLPAGVDPNNMPAGGVPGQMPGLATNGQAGETKIPFLIKFDKYVSGQTYQGYTKLALRTYGITYDEAMLEEPLTNYVFSLMGLPATETAYTGLQINEETEALYVLSEVVDDQIYLDRYFSNANGVLYKAEVGSSLTYVNDDPSSYTNSFSQETRVNDADMAPLIGFARFLTESDDATFGSELPNYLDVDAFATYLAITNLLVNNDSIVGMNNNYYLYYDDIAERFSLMYWDGNESLGGLGMGTSATFDLYFREQTGSRSPGGDENILLQRFKANAAFMALYEEKLRLVYEEAFLSGAITEKAEEYSALVLSINEERNLVNVENYEQSVENILTFINQRMDYVNSTGLMDE
ncbi:MAG: CotH kinase family protein [Chloroflexi bacterium]|nr:CotH kinase family protein [Chloroflexota bacterium]